MSNNSLSISYAQFRHSERRVGGLTLSFVGMASRQSLLHKDESRPRSFLLTIQGTEELGALDGVRGLSLSGVVYIIFVLVSPSLLFRQSTLATTLVVPVQNVGREESFIRYAIQCIQHNIFDGHVEGVASVGAKARRRKNMESLTRRHQTM